jgi:hypothetical protein
MKGTTIPDIVYLFVMLFAKPAEGAMPYRELYWTQDKAACEAQAKEWSATLAPTRFACVSHQQKRLKDQLDAGDSQ